MPHKTSAPAAVFTPNPWLRGAGAARPRVWDEIENAYDARGSTSGLDLVVVLGNPREAESSP